MRRDKRERWALNETLPCVHQPDLKAIVAGETYLRGEWGVRGFGAERPLTLELGCGQGLFSVDLAQRFPARNVIGIDVKGHRFWRGAQRATEREVPNVAFLRTRIQWLDRYFARGEVDRIWLTFPDPQVADKRGTKCLVSLYYLRLYASVLGENGTLRVKTDSPEFFERAIESAPHAGMRVVDRSSNVHGEPQGRFTEELAGSLGFITAFEERWIQEGRRIHFVELAPSEAVDRRALDEALRMLQGPKDRSVPRYRGCE